MKHKESLFLVEHIAFRMGGVPKRWAHRAEAAQATMLPEEQLQPHNHSTVTVSQELLYAQPSSGRRERAYLQQIQAMLFLMLQSATAA